MGLKLSEHVIDFLKSEPGKKFSAREIAEWVVLKFPKECQAKKQSSQRVSTDVELLRQLAGEISSWRTRLQKKHPQLKTTEGNPRKYYYSEQTDSAEVDAAENPSMAMGSPSVKCGEHEHALYPLLSAFLWEEFEVYSKRINEKRSSNKRGTNGNLWLHPDVVGMKDLGAEWCPEVRDCVNHYSDKRTNLWSFEVKQLINRSNVRKSFFQSVSNSSWANFGYLVAAEIEGQGTLKELRVLFATHGIGLIKLDVENPSESQVLIPAKERTEIDWDTINRLATENKNFLEYMKLVKQFYQTGEVRASDWDVPKEPSSE
ncbi:MAG: HrgA protein [Candidatus Nephrothrix sp. EaCA]|nr:MAG: HrgA protein [Candidatus Nephrothrix sp. EaCA]